MKPTGFRVRARLFLILVALMTLALTARLVDLQILQTDHFRDLAKRQIQESIEVDLPRAEIVDRTGTSLAVSVRCPSLFTFDPSRIENHESLAESVAALSGCSKREVLDRMEGRSKFTWIARKLPFTALAEAEAIKEANEGCELMLEAGRFYPQGILASNLIGCMGTDGGLSGLEHQWDDLLSGGTESYLVMRDAVATRLIPLEVVSGLDPKATRVRITLDSAIQYEAERLLQEAVETHNAAMGAVVLLDPTCGDILAMAVRPTFDPNDPGGRPDKTWWNWCVNGAYEPGSTLKVVTVAGSLESGRFGPHDEIYVGDGTMTLGRKTIHDDHPPKVPKYTVEEVLIHSSNVGAARIGMAMGPESLYHYIRLFGFGEVTALGFEGERAGILRPPEKWNTLSNAMLSFGQELAVSPLQLTLAYAVIASGGYRVVPRILPDAPAPPRKRLLSPRTVRDMNRMMVRVVDEGTGKSAAIPGVSVAGKTGTAQKMNRMKNNGKSHHTAFFAGYAPAENPKVVCLVMVDEPIGAYYGGAVAAPVFSELVGFALKKLRTEAPRDPVVLAHAGGAQ